MSQVNYYRDNVRIGAALRGGGELVQRIKTSVLENLSYDKNNVSYEIVLIALKAYVIR